MNGLIKLKFLLENKILLIIFIYFYNKIYFTYFYNKYYYNIYYES